MVYREYEEVRVSLYMCCGFFIRGDLLDRARDTLRERFGDCIDRCIEVGVVRVKKPKG